MARLRRVYVVGVAGAIVLGAIGLAAAPASAEQGQAVDPNWAWRVIDINGALACGVRDDGVVKCWGANNFGQLGQGDTEDRGDEPGEMGASLAPIDLGPGRTARTVSTSPLFACAILDDGSVKCWGLNSNGQLGQGDTEHRGDEPGEMGANLPPVDLGPGRTALDISLGNGFACALLDDHSVKCWGDNTDGRLGQGDTEDRGDAPGEMGSNLAPIALGTGHSARAISAGGYTACAIRQDDSLVCWGNGVAGQLGSGVFFDVRGDGPGEMGDALPAIDLGGFATAAVSVGGGHVCAVRADGAVVCWGRNVDGQLGLGDTANRGDNPGEMGANLPTVDLGVGQTAAGIAAGDSHSCALLDNGSLRCWGSNPNGELGLGDTANRGDAPGEMGGSLPVVDPGGQPLAVSAGISTTCAVLSTGSYRCWGGNVFGTLGVGDTEDRGDEPGEMGSNLPAVALGAPAAQVRADYRFLRSRVSSAGAAPNLVDVGPGTNTFARERVAGPLRSVLQVPLGNGIDVRTLSSVVPRDHYTVVALFRLDDVGDETDDYRRILNFAEEASDNGLYTNDTGHLEFYPLTPNDEAGSVENDEWVQVALTRTRVGRLRVYLDGTQVLDLNDEGRDGVVASPGDVLRLFKDDSRPDEDSSAAIARLRLWNRPLTPAQVAALAELPPAVRLTRNRATAPQQSSIRVTGEHFGPLEQVRITIRDRRGVVRSLATPRSNRAGLITRSVYIPAVMVDGPARITATGLTSRLTATTNLTIR